MVTPDGWCVLLIAPHTIIPYKCKKSAADACMNHGLALALHSSLGLSGRTHEGSTHTSGCDAEL